MKNIFWVVMLFLVGCGGNEVPLPVHEMRPMEVVFTETRQTFAESKLEKIVEMQKLASAERELLEVQREYEFFIADNPDSVEGHILYGKFLRQTSQDEKALEIFMKANRLNPEIAVVKQQIGNFLAERGEPEMALVYFMAAVELEPKTALYHYQMGELLTTYAEQMVRERILTNEQLDSQMEEAFRRAAELDRENWDFQMRHGQVYFDLYERRWEEALGVWKVLEDIAPTVLDREIVYLSQARVLMGLKRDEEARERLNLVFDPSLEKSRRELLAGLPGQEEEDN